MSGVIGGRAKLVLIPVKSDHSGLQTYSAGAVTTTVPTTEAGGFVFKKNGNGILISTDIAIGDDNKGTLTVPTTNWDEDTYKFFKLMKPMNASSSSQDPEELYDEDGIKIGGAGTSTDGQQFLLISYGKTDIYFSIVTGSWKGVKRENNKWIQPQMTFVSVACSDTDGLTIPTTIFDSTMFTVATAPVLAYNAYGEFIFPTPA